MGFITDSEIDKILGRMTEKTAKTNARPAIDTNKESVEDKANLRALHAQKKAQDFASMYAPKNEKKEWTGRDNISFFNNQALSAGIVRRTYAFITDLCVVGFVMLGIVYGALYFFGTNTFNISGVYGVNKVTWLLIGLYASLFVFYVLYFEALCGQTLGKMFLNVRIVDKKNKKPGFLKIITRSFIFLLLPLGLLGLHNVLTGTKLVMND
jgi:uncharacterized RDD family membrane protein YckC